MGCSASFDRYRFVPSFAPCSWFADIRCGIARNVPAMSISATIFYQRCILGLYAQPRFSAWFWNDFGFGMRFHTNVAHSSTPYHFVASVAVYAFCNNVAAFYIFCTSRSTARCFACFLYTFRLMSLFCLFLVWFCVQCFCFYLFLVRIRVNVVVPTRATADPVVQAATTFPRRQECISP